MRIERMVELCTTCCQTSFYDKGDYRFQELPGEKGLS